MSNSILNFYDDCCFDKANIDAIWVLQFAHKQQY